MKGQERAGYWTRPMHDRLIVDVTATTREVILLCLPKDFICFFISTENAATVARTDNPGMEAKEITGVQGL